MINILAFDPGSNITGWAALSCEPLTYVNSGVIKLAGQDFFDKIKKLKQELEFIIKQFEPSIIVLERAFVGINKDSALKLAQIRGAIMLFCAQEDVVCVEYSPRQAKQYITGYGAASKEQVAMMIEKLLKRSFNGHLDETDAAALALCHYFCQKRHFLLA